MGCHKKIDPLGFGLENYDAIGSWRESGPELDTSGELPGGRKFNGAGELKKIIWERRAEFVRNFTGQMLAYGLGRELDYYDVRTVSQIAASLEPEGHRFSCARPCHCAQLPFPPPPQRRAGRTFAGAGDCRLRKLISS
jgi:hypothetical protein